MNKKWKSGLMVIRTVLLLTALVWVVSVPLGAEPQGWPEIAAHALAQPPADASATNKGTAKAGNIPGKKRRGRWERMLCRLRRRPNKSRRTRRLPNGWREGQQLLRGLSWRRGNGSRSGIGNAGAGCSK